MLLKRQCKLAVGLTTLTPILPFVHLYLPLVVEYVLLANKTPPKFILFVVPADKLMFVPIIILFGPIEPIVLDQHYNQSMLNN
jgi:hypothetical protein